MSAKEMATNGFGYGIGQWHAHKSEQCLFNEPSVH